MLSKKGELLPFYTIIPSLDTTHTYSYRYYHLNVVSLQCPNNQIKYNIYMEELSQGIKNKVLENGI